MATLKRMTMDSNSTSTVYNRFLMTNKFAYNYMATFSNLPLGYKEASYNKEIFILGYHWHKDDNKVLPPTKA